MRAPRIPIPQDEIAAFCRKRMITGYGACAGRSAVGQGLRNVTPEVT